MKDIATGKNMNKSIKALTIFGILWNGLSQFSTQVFQFIVIIILARLLSPEDFGIVGLATIFMGLFAAVNELGLSAAIIQKKDINDIYLSTSFWANVAMSIIMFILTIIISPFIADFFREDIVGPILIVSSIGFMIGSFSIIHRSLLEKNLNFKKIAIAEVCTAFGSGIISIYLAISGMGVWSIVLGSFSGNIISVIVLWKVSTWRPSLKFSIAHFQELFRFGCNVMGSRLLSYMAMRVDYLVVGRLLGTTSLGYYTLARTLTSFPVQKISWTVMRVMFPAFSSIQKDHDAFKKGYLKVVRYVSLVTFPMLAGMFIVASDFVLVFYGQKWSPMIILLQILCVQGALVSISAITTTIQYSKGRSDLQFRWQVYTMILMPIAVIIGANYGLLGVASALTIMIAFFALIFQMVTNKLIDLDMHTFLKETFPALISSIILIIGVQVYKTIPIYGMQLIYVLLGSIFIGIIAYIISVRIFYSHIFDEIKLLFSEVRGKTMKN